MFTEENFTVKIYHCVIFINNYSTNVTRSHHYNPVFMVMSATCGLPVLSLPVPTGKYLWINWAHHIIPTYPGIFFDSDMRLSSMLDGLAIIPGESEKSDIRKIIIGLNTQQ